MLTSLVIVVLVVITSFASVALIAHHRQRLLDKQAFMPAGLRRRMNEFIDRIQGDEFEPTRTTFAQLLDEFDELFDADFRERSDFIELLNALEAELDRPPTAELFTNTQRCRRLVEIMEKYRTDHEETRRILTLAREETDETPLEAARKRGQNAK